MELLPELRREGVEAMSEEYIGWLDEEWNTVLDQSQPIVRCRDCKHYGCDGYDDHYCYYWDKIREPDGYCAWGKRYADMDNDAAEYQAAINPNTDFDR